MTIRFEVYGVQQAVSQLRKYDRDMYNDIIKDLRNVAAPLASKVGAGFPETPFRRVSNWHTTNERKGKVKFPPYVGSKARSGVKPAVSTSKGFGGSVGLLRLQQMDGGGQIYDSAGSKANTKAGMRFVSNLDKPFSTKSKTGKFRSRVLFPLMEQNMPMIQASITATIDRLNKIVQDHIQRAA
jgi:hypothetical protein